jgi:hypothetical protein
MRLVGSLLIAAAALLAVLATPGVQAWVIAPVQPIYQGPLDDYVDPLLDPLCIPDVHTSGEPPFVTFENPCPGTPAAPPPEAVAGNSTGESP